MTSSFFILFWSDKFMTLHRPVAAGGQRGLKPPHRNSEPPHQPSAPSPDISPPPAISVCASSVDLRHYDCWVVWRVRLPRPSSYEVQQESPNFSGRGATLMIS